MSQIILASKRNPVPSPVGYRRIDVTSHAKDIFRTCSPFLCGPVRLYGGYTAKCVENAYQYAKVYREFIGEDGLPSSAYFEWAQSGWNSSVAVRRPFGYRGPKYSWWDGEKLDLIESRRKIYIPLYSKAVVKTPGFKELQRLYAAGENLCLIDYDAYDMDSLGYTPDDVINDDTRTLGHCFVLKFLLEGHIPMPRPFRVIIAGGRDFTDYELLKRYCDSVLRNKVDDGIEIVCGKARGADYLGEKYAIERGFGIKFFPAEWESLGKRAGFVRNEQMARYADAVIAFWDGQSHGTKHMIDIATENGLAIRVKKY